MSISSQIILTGVLFLLIIGSGIWLSRLGRPYKTGIFTIHKLITLAASVSSIVMIFNLFMTVKPVNLIVLFFLAAGISVVVLFATGALLSASKLRYSALKITHIIATVTAFSFAGLSVYLLLK
ncbi:MAG: hypothetical protein WCN92_06020 [Eubacteriales bacterium]